MIAVATLIASGCAAPPRRATPPPDVAEAVNGSLLSTPSPQCGAEPRTGALHRAVDSVDAAFRWEILREERDDDGVLLHLSLVSQEWRGIPWEHSLLLFLPRVSGDAELLMMVLRQGGPLEADPAALRTIGRATGTAAAFLFAVPNQPLFDGLEEDPLLAYTYSQFLRTGDDSWPLLFPMVRSAARAMDAVEEATTAIGALPLRRYVVAGHSKRGHAAWLAASADPRVVGIVPIAIDVLNSRAQIAHQRAVAGEISASSQIFSEVIELADSPRGRCLMTMIDPYTYRSALTEPKLVVLGTNDDYTAVDALNLYWDDLPGPRSLLYLPNTTHAGSNAHPWVNATAFAFVRAIAAGESLPEIEWSTAARDGTLRVRVNPPASARSARIWTSRAPGRDFRASSWTETVMRRTPRSTASAAPTFAADVELPVEGYAALFVEVELETDDQPYRLSTPLRMFEGGTGRRVEPTR